MDELVIFMLWRHTWSGGLVISRTRPGLSSIQGSWGSQPVELGSAAQYSIIEHTQGGLFINLTAQAIKTT